MDKLHPAKSRSLYTQSGLREIRGRNQEREEIGRGFVSWKNEFESLFEGIGLVKVPWI